MGEFTDLETRLAALEAVVGSPVSDSRARSGLEQLGEDVANLKERMSALVADNQRDRNVIATTATSAAKAAVRESIARLPHQMVEAMEPMVADLIELEGKVRKTAREAREADEALRASVGAAVLEAKSASTASANAASAHFRGHAAQFVFGGL